MSLKNKKCVPCEGGVPKLSTPEITKLLKQIKGWQATTNDKIQKVFRFKNFMHAIGFVNDMAVLAENEGHHPDFEVHYNVVTVTLWTHAVEGLTENDFILAAKIDELL